MSSPTARASNVWEVNAGDDLLQFISEQGGSLGGIDSTGKGFGSLISGGVGVVLKQKVTLTATQIISISNSGIPVQLVAAPGVGNILVPISVSLTYHAGPTPFSIVGSNQMRIGLGSTFSQINANTYFSPADTNFLDQVSDKYQNLVSGGSADSTVTDSDNQPLSIGTADTLSNGNGSLTVVMLYAVVSES